MEHTMSDSLSSEASAKLRALCGRITEACELGDDIREELFGHLEDKLLAYLSGEEKLSEQDALILVREHFGDAENLRRLLRKVHAPKRCIMYAGRFAGLPAARV
jgi:hypothetical protein